MDKKKGKYGELYRVQSASVKRAYFSNRAYPAKRVIINGLGKIEFNPDSDLYVYFSRTDKHQAYYIFNKVLKIVNEELAKAKKENIASSDKLPDKLRMYQFYSDVYFEIIRKVKDFFAYHIPNSKLEIVSLKYLNGFSKYFEYCAITNRKKSARTHCPEVSDTSIYGGAYGVNDAWLELLECCTISTKTTNISISKFFNFMQDTAYRAKVNNQTLGAVLKSDTFLFEIMNFFTSNERDNPQFKNRENINKIYKLIDEIEAKKLYRQDKKFDDKFFDHMKKELKEEILEMR